MLDRLRIQNPWWVSTDSVHQDPHILAAQAAGLGWRPPILDTLDLAGPFVYTLRGPRQVGKTTALKLLVQHLVEKGKSPRRIVYYALDLEETPEQIVAIVQAARSLFPREEGSRWFFLDEISGVPNWQRAIKFLRDQTAARGDCFVLTGSSARDIRRGGERLPGRRGPAAALGKILFPLSFREFCSARGLPAPPAVLGLEDFLEPPEHHLRQAALLLDELDRALSLYLRCGGLPRAVADVVATGQVAPATIRALWDTLAGDVERWDRERMVALKVLERATRMLGTPSSWRSLAGEVGVALPTLEDYVSLLADSFLLLVLYAWDEGRRTAATRRPKKLYFFDPLVADAPRSLQPELPPPSEAALVESVVAASLFRAVERDLTEAFGMPGALFYWRSKKGNEIDFLAGTRAHRVPIEVRYQATISGHDRRAIQQAFRRGILLSRSQLDLSGPVPVLPAALFLWMLKEEPAGYPPRRPAVQ